MPEVGAPAPPGRRLLAVLAGPVPAPSLAELVQVLTGDFGYRHELPHLAGVSGPEAVPELERWLAGPAADDDGVPTNALVYWAGVPARNVPLADLASAVSRGGLANCLLIVDAWREPGEDGPAVPTEAARPPSRTWTAMFVRSPEEVARHPLAHALVAELRDVRHGSVTQPELDLRSLLAGAGRSIGETPQVVDGLAVRAALLPNPRHRPDVPPGLDIATQRRLLSRADLAGHWGPRARGIETEAERGWHFTGRTRALRELTGWLEAADADPRMRVVTGGPGSGKSSVLARIVTFADPEYRAGIPAAEVPSDGTVPAAGSIDVAVHARARSVRDLVAAIGEALGVPAAEPSIFVNELVAGRPRATIVVDALDEAEDPRQVARTLLAPLAAARVPGLRLLVGTRRELLPALGAAKRVLDLDDPGYIEVADVEEYTYKLLVADEGPYRARPRIARQVATAVAVRAVPNFLVARIVARTLAESDELVDVRRRDWRVRFPDTVGDALDMYLERFGADEERVRDLLTPLAYAWGEGLPWEDVWARSASALSGRVYTDHDVVWLLARAGAYVVETAEDGRSVYRLFHQALADHLRAAGRAAAAHGHLARSLVAGSPTVAGSGRTDWVRAHPYVRRYLAQHAARAGLLDELVTDPLFLVAAAPDELVGVLDTVQTDAAARPARIYGQAAHRLSWEGYGGNAAILELLAQAEREPDLASAFRLLNLRQPWTVPWAWWTPSHRYRLVGRHDGAVRALALTEIDDRPTAVTGGADGTVRRWDCLAGTLLDEPLSGHAGPVTAVLVVDADGERLIVSGDATGVIRRWSLLDGTPAGLPVTAHTGSVNALTVDGDGTGLLSAGADGTVRRWRLLDGAPAGDVVEVPGGPVTALTVTGAGEDAVLVTAGVDGAVRRWRLSDGTPAGPALPGHRGAVTCLASAGLPAGDVVLSGGTDWNVRSWDLADESSVEMSGRHDDVILDICLATVRGTPWLATASSDNTLLLGRFDDEEGGGFRLSHDSAVTAVVILEHQDAPAVVTASADSTVRFWTVDDGDGGDGLADNPYATSTVDVGFRDGRPLLATGHKDGAVRVWDADTGLRIGVDGGVGHGDWINELMVVPTLSGGVVLSAGGDGTVREWALADGRHRRVCLTRENGTWINSVATYQDGERTVAAAGDYDGLVHRWDVETGEPVAAPFQANEGSVATVAAIGGVLLTAGNDGVIRRWDPRTAQRLTPQLTGHASAAWCVAVGVHRGRHIAVSGDGDGAIRAWDVRAGTVLGHIPAAHDGVVYGLAFGTLAGRPRIVSGGADGILKVWRFPDRLDLAVRLGSGIMSVALAGPDQLVAATWRGTVAFRLLPGG
ncbi:hypothetical protein [Plantactinospora endophytica]|uniref:Orc1-like AAA ATPase domain-containing protein n=1 Tax=Plantactinospora endophytica TaxID=673535 RepID=A0ABQ4DY43_9ACTN|nr:hypothetical protein [Plantactinospora endophytica]GIG87365.1 hypothetical protein Pen02_23010 [Plantactinospora endophytica]